MLKVDKIKKSFGTKTVLNAISFSCGDTGTTAIMGASGIGKTTLLNILAGIDPPDEGTIDSTFAKISYKFQEPRLFPWLTALENVKSVIAVDSNADTIAREHLTLVGLSDSVDKYPSELSGGMQQRVSLARALAYGGDLLLLDEPFSAVDSDTKTHLLQVVKSYAKDHAVILVTHDPSEAEELDATVFTLFSPQ